MACKSNTVIHNEDCNMDDETRIMDEHFNQSAQSKEHYLLQNKIYYVECKSDVNTKIEIKQETWDSNVVSRDIKSNAPTLDLMSFTGTIKGDEVDIKEEHLNQDEISTESKKHNLLQNEIYIEECVWRSGTNQETCGPNIVYSGIKSDEPPTCIGTGTIKCDDEIDIIEEPWWCDLHNDEKESNGENNEESEDILPLESPRLPKEAVFPNGNTIVYLDVEKDGASHKTVNGKKVSSGTSMRQNICSLKSNPTCDYFESEQNMGDENTQLYMCGICDKSYKQKSSLKNHILLHSGTTPYKCEHCEKYFTRKSSLISHKLVHAGTKPYKCNICEKCFTQKSYLKTHKRLHSGIKPYKCDICEKYFRRKSYFQSHKLLHSDTPRYKCDICEKCFTQNSDLQKHSLLHSGIKPYKCDICKKCYPQKSDLKKHILFHSGTRPYKCDICEKCFTLESSLKSHKLIHSGRTPYKCDVCEKRFSRKSELRSHKWLHSGTTAYKCNECEKCFTRKSYLQSHKWLHSGTTPYKCDECEKCFTRHSHLQSHKLIHSGTKPYKCDVCEKCFTQKSSLRRHTLQH